mmetsp:Transcript_66321/g.179284  ORF Transcript_66321/g.179284 Transcript_66321/m.179284 type:complete len:203 (-) Transcript_66321:55-663(-)
MRCNTSSNSISSRSSSSSAVQLDTTMPWSGHGAREQRRVVHQHRPVQGPAQPPQVLEVAVADLGAVVSVQPGGDAPATGVEPVQHLVGVALRGGREDHDLEQPRRGLQEQTHAGSRVHEAAGACLLELHGEGVPQAPGGLQAAMRQRLVQVENHREPLVSGASHASGNRRQQRSPLLARRPLARRAPVQFRQRLQRAPARRG